MSYDPVDPVNTKWSVAFMDNEGSIGAFHGTPWEFYSPGLTRAPGHWTGTYEAITDSDGSYHCTNSLGDEFEVHVVAAERFIATKNGELYCFGKRIPS